VNPPNTTDIDYIAGVGVGLFGDTVTYSGSGLVVIRYIDA
jgi:hypothetical protein